MKKIVLLTGATGLIGSQVLPHLLDSFDQVHTPYNSQRGPDLPNTVWHPCNLLNQRERDELIAVVKPTHLLHLAWYTKHGKYWNAPENLHWVQATLGLVESFVNNGGKRAVIAGSCAEYDWSEGDLNETTTPLNPSTLYGETKASLYKILNSYALINELSLAWGRIFFLHGPNEAPSRFVPSVIQSLLQNKDVKCSHGHQIRDFLHVEDIARAFSTLLDSKLQGAINIASGEGYPLREIIHLLTQMVNSKGSIIYGALPVAKNDPPKLVGDVTRLHTELNWRPRYTLSEGLHRTVEWHQSQLHGVLL